MATDSLEAPSPTSQSPSHYSQLRHFYLAVDRLQFKMETLVDLLGMAGRRPCLPMVVCCSTRDELDSVCFGVSNLSHISIASLRVKSILTREGTVKALKKVFENLEGVTNDKWSDMSEMALSTIQLYMGNTPLMDVFNETDPTELWDKLKKRDLAEAERALILEKFRQATIRWNQIATCLSRDDNEIENDEKKSHLIVVTDVCLPLLASGESPIAARALINYELPTKKEMYMRRMATCLAADGIVVNMVVGGEVVTLKSLEESSGLVIDEMPINIFEML